MVKCSGQYNICKYKYSPLFILDIIIYPLNYLYDIYAYIDIAATTTLLVESSTFAAGYPIATSSGKRSDDQPMCHPLRVDWEDLPSVVPILGARTCGPGVTRFMDIYGYYS